MPQEVSTRLLGVMAPNLQVLQLVGPPPPGMVEGTLFLQGEDAMAVPITPQEVMTSALIPLMETMEDTVPLVARFTDLLPTPRAFDLLQEEGWRTTRAYYENLLDLREDGPIVPARFLILCASFFAPEDTLKAAVRLGALTPSETALLMNLYLTIYHMLAEEGREEEGPRPPMGFGPTP